MSRPPICPNPFLPHLRDLSETRDHACGHQYDQLPCGCVLVDDHDTEQCDGQPVAELEESNR